MGRYERLQRWIKSDTMTQLTWCPICDGEEEIKCVPVDLLSEQMVFKVPDSFEESFSQNRLITWDVISHWRTVESQRFVRKALIMGRYFVGYDGWIELVNGCIFRLHDDGESEVLYVTSQIVNGKRLGRPPCDTCKTIEDLMRHIQSFEASAKDHKRRQIRGPKIDKSTRQLLYARDKGICHLCGQPVDYNDFHLDHVDEVSVSRNNSFDNLRVSHPSCNMRKNKGKFLHWLVSSDSSSELYPYWMNRVKYPDASCPGCRGQGIDGISGEVCQCVRNADATVR